MMTIDSIEHEFKEKVCDGLSLMQEGIQRYRVLTPFVFGDGDHLGIVLKRQGINWVLSDEGHTFMHLTYSLDERDLQRGTRQQIISDALSVFGVDDREGELILPIKDDLFGDALYSYIQALLKITDVTFLTRERVKSTFLDDFIDFMSETVPEERRTFDWTDSANDKEEKYQVDCRVNQMAAPLFIFALPNDDKVRDATITLLKFDSWDFTFRTMGIFENQEGINRKVLARFTDVCDKQFSSLTANRDRIARYMREILGTSIR